MLQIIPHSTDQNVQFTIVQESLVKQKVYEMEQKY